MMAEDQGNALNAQSNIRQIVSEAQHRWLRPDEICEILQNYKVIGIASEPPDRPQSGSLFLFDRKVLRHFRNDGHNWRKKKDRKLVNEGHERLKVGNAFVLNCYYARGEDNENFRRRSYWMLEGELSHIALVHYLEEQINRTDFERFKDGYGPPGNRQIEEGISNPEVENPAVSRFQPGDYQGAAQVIDTTGLDRTQPSEHEDAPSDNYPGRFSASASMSFGSLTQGEKIADPKDIGFTYELPQDLGFPSLGNAVESSSAGYQSDNFQPSLPWTQSRTISTMPGQGNEMLDQVFTGGIRKRQVFGSPSDGLEDWRELESYFQRKQLKEYGDNEFGMSDECDVSLLAQKTTKAGQYDEPVQAAIRIQNKFRSWKGRKDFLLIRQRIIKIQAAYSKVLNNPEGDLDDDSIDIDALLY